MTYEPTSTIPPLHPGAGLPPTPPPSWAAVPSEDERRWAMLAHLSSFAAAWLAHGLLCPLVVLLTKGDSSPYVRHHAVESLNFQITALIASAVSGVLVFVLIGIPMLLAVGAIYLVLVIRAGITANDGGWYRYPLSYRFVR